MLTISVHRKLEIQTMSDLSSVCTTHPKQLDLYRGDTVGLLAKFEDRCLQLDKTAQ